MGLLIGPAVIVRNLEPAYRLDGPTFSVEKWLCKARLTFLQFFEICVGFTDRRPARTCVFLNQGFQILWTEGRSYPRFYFETTFVLEVNLMA